MKNLSADKSMVQMAADIVEKCKYIHPSRTEEIEQVCTRSYSVIQKYCMGTYIHTYLFCGMTCLVEPSIWLHGCYCFRRINLSWVYHSLHLPFCVSTNLSTLPSYFLLVTLWYQLTQLLIKLRKYALANPPTQNM